jgi:hypothetical protein
MLFLELLGRRVSPLSWLLEFINGDFSSPETHFFGQFMKGQFVVRGFGLSPSLQLHGLLMHPNTASFGAGLQNSCT